MNKTKKQTKVALFFGGMISQHLVMIRKAAKKLGVDLDLVSYNRVCFDSQEKRVKIRGNLGRWGSAEEWINLGDYDVLFFRTTGKHWEEVDLVVKEVKQMNGKKPVIVDPIILNGKPSMACKAYQMLALGEAGIDVPRSIYGSLWYLYDTMKEISNNQISRNKQLPISKFQFPIIIKGSGGDRGTRVFKADNLGKMEILVRDLRKTETEEGKRYMLQEFIPNDGDFRVFVLGGKVLGVMKRSAKQNSTEFRNNYSAGGSVEVAELPVEIKQLAVKAAKACGLAVAGVDVAFRNNDRSRPVIWEVNKGPQFKGFMEATGIDVPREIVKYLVSLRDNSQ
ncbi:hypothetical protein HYV64_03970 [Candidatus Shapirobacteria bacterium]|nr:hypothetical protein [Candidatus Shapirobacteria bacterium]